MRFIAFSVILTCLLFLVLSFAVGQEKVGELVNDPNFDVKKNTDLLVLRDPTDTLRTCLFAINGRQILAQEFDNNYQKITSHTYDKLYDLQFPNLIGGIYAQKKSVLVYANGKNKSFNAISVDNERKFLINKEIKIGKDEIFLESFELERYFYLVTVGWANSYLVFYKMGSDFNVETHKVVLGDLSFGEGEKGLYNNLLDFYGKKRISKVSYETINSLATSTGQNKIYFFDKTFTLTLDKYYGQTLILRVNLQDWSKSFKIIDLKNNDCKKSNSNSFLFYDWLFKSQICDDQLRFSVFDFKTEVELNTFIAESENEILFKNTPITQEGGNTIYAADSRELSKTKPLIRKMLNSEISIAVNFPKFCKSCFEVTIGSFEEKEMASGGGPGYSGGTSVPMGGAMIPVQGSFSPTYNGYTKSTWTKSAFFKTLLQGDNFSHKQGQIEKNDFDRIEDFVASKESKIVTKTVFYKADQYYLTYFNKDSKNFIVMRF